jgi:hypothetical protein
VNTLSRLASACLLVALATPAAALPGTSSPDRLRADPAAELQFAETKIFKLLNPMPFPVQVRVLGDGPTFPMVVLAPAPPAPPVPIPYPNTKMQVQVRPAGTSTWSPIFTLPWKSGSITLPGF